VLDGMASKEEPKKDVHDKRDSDGKLEEIITDKPSDKGRTMSVVAPDDAKKKHATVKVGMLGDPAVGKTSLATKYVENEYKEDYIQTLGVLPQEKTVELKNTSITFNVFDLGGDEQFLSMLPMVCNDAVAIMFVFDLTRIATLKNLRNWYTQARVLNKTAHTFLIGTKYDAFAEMKAEDKDEVTKQAIKVAGAMKAPLVFCSAAVGINVQAIFKIIISKVFNVKVNVKQFLKVGEPIIMYE